MAQAKTYASRYQGYKLRVSDAETIEFVKGRFETDNERLQQVLDNNAAFGVDYVEFAIRPETVDVGGMKVPVEALLENAEALRKENEELKKALLEATAPAPDESEAGPEIRVAHKKKPPRKK